MMELSGLDCNILTETFANNEEMENNWWALPFSSRVSQLSMCSSKVDGEKLVGHSNSRIFSSLWFPCIWCSKIFSNINDKDQRDAEMRKFKGLIVWRALNFTFGDTAKTRRIVWSCRNMEINFISRLGVRTRMKDGKMDMCKHRDVKWSLFPYFD